MLMTGVLCTVCGAQVYLSILRIITNNICQYIHVKVILHSRGWKSLIVTSVVYLPVILVQKFQQRTGTFVQLRLYLPCARYFCQAFFKGRHKEVGALPLHLPVSCQVNTASHQVKRIFSPTLNLIG